MLDQYQSYVAPGEKARDGEVGEVRREGEIRRSFASASSTQFPLSQPCGHNERYALLVHRAAYVLISLCSQMTHSSKTLPVLPLSTSPFRHHPWKALYIAQHLLITGILMPYWAAKRLLGLDPFPKSWTLKEVIVVQTMRFVSWVLPRCDFPFNVSPLGSLPSVKFKETRVVWIEAAGAEWVKGVGRSELAEPVRVPGYVWGKGKDDEGQMKVGEGENVLLYLHGGGT